MTQRLSLGLAAGAAILAAGCVNHRPIRNGLLDESAYLDKAQLAERDWLLAVTTVEASSPNLVSEWVFPGFMSDMKFVRLRFSEDTLQVLDGRKLQADDPASANDDMTTSTAAVMFEIPGRHVDIKLRENLDGERTNFLEENTEAEWQVRQRFKAELEGVSRDPLALIAWYYEAFLADCASTASVRLVPGSLEQPNDAQDQPFFTFEIEVTYQPNLLTYFSYCYDMVSLSHNSGETSVRYRFAFLARDPGEYVPVTIEEKDPVNKKYGTFQVRNIFRDAETGLLGVRNLLHRWDPQRQEPVVYYFHEGYPERFKPMWDEIVSETNRVLTDAGAHLRVEVREWDDGGVERRLGDTRYSFITWHQDIDSTMGLLGYGPSLSDPRTGEIVAGNVNLYNIGYDWYRYFVQDFLEEQGGTPRAAAAAAENLPADTAWEDIPCALGTNLPAAPTEARTASTLFSEMRRLMEIDTDSTVGLPGADPTDDFLPEPIRPEFIDDYHRILPEYRYGNPGWNPYVYHDDAMGNPLARLPEMMATEREFMGELNAVLMNQNPFGPVALYGRDGIAAQNDFLERFRAFRRNHEELTMAKEMLQASRNIYVFNEQDALAAINRGARRCSGGRWESDDAYRERIIESVVFWVTIHEFGHTLSLRHNFYGSVDHKHMREAGAIRAETTASVMDYVAPSANTAHNRRWGLYDEAALTWIYGSEVRQAEVMAEDFLYCTDEHRSFSPLCQAYDLGVTPSQITLNAIESYDYGYKFRNRRAFRTFWDTTRYVGAVYNAVFPLQRFWYLSIFDWGGAGVQDTLKRLDQVTEGATVLTDAEYDEIAIDFFNDAYAANTLILAFYDAVLNQASSFRNYQTEFDPFYGDVLRLGIVIDKLFTTFAFMDLTEVWNYDPNIYTYVAMYDAPFGPRAAALSDRVLDDMLGSNYDTFEWFRFFALNVFGYVTNSNLIGNTALRDRIAIERYENAMELELRYPGALDQATRADNPVQLFIHDGEEYIYTFLEDRAWHLVARKARSPVSFQYMRDYNEEINAGANPSLDNYELKVLLAYYEYYNNFQGF